MLSPIAPQPKASAHDLDYFLRRAEEEAIAQIRSANAIAADRHGELARAYGDRARRLLSQ